MSQKMEYVRLGKSGLKVSKIILGCMSYGSSKWEGSPWVMDEEESLEIIKTAYDHGINTWDTANTYSNGASEVIVGKALKRFGIPRSKVVILSKVYYPVMEDESRPAAVNDGPLVNQMGLSRKHIFDAVERSLERLQTDYIDVLQIHRLDRETEPEEIMRALDDVVRSGRVRYLGASSMRAWEFARLQYTARLRGWTEFVSMQPFHNLLYREEEREMLPLCRAEGVGVIPWSPLARGLLARPRAKTTTTTTTDDKTGDGTAEDDGKKEEVGSGSSGGGGGGSSSSSSNRAEQDVKAKRWNAEANLEIVDAVEAVARARGGIPMAQVATAWVLRQGCWPIVGLNSAARVAETVGALAVRLTDDECALLERGYRARDVQGFS